MSTNNGGPAFPCRLKETDGQYQARAMGLRAAYGNSTSAVGSMLREEYNYPGMTLRDYFAAHAPEPPVDWHGGDRKVADLIEWRWRYADAMLKAREAA